MRRWLAACVLGLAIASSGCGSASNHEQVTQETVAVFKELNATLASAKDKASAEAIRPKITELGQKFMAVKAKAAALGPAPPDADKAMQAKYEGQLKAELLGIMQNIATLTQNPETAEPLKDVLENLQQSMRPSAGK